MNYSNFYLETIEKLINHLKENQKTNIETASKAIANAYKNNRWLFVFGTGHSHMVTEEFFYRAGGLVKVYPIFDTALMLHEGAVKSTSMERLFGYAKALLDDTPIQHGDVLIISSNSGRNAVPVEMAMEAKARGVTVIALTSLAHSSNVLSRHASGKRLFELADIVIDNGGIFGDACVSTKEDNVSSTSTVINSIVVNLIIATVVELMEKENLPIECFSSSNTDAGEKRNQKLISKYKNYVRSL